MKALRVVLTVLAVTVVFTLPAAAQTAAAPVQPNWAIGLGAGLGAALTIIAGFRTSGARPSQVWGESSESSGAVRLSHSMAKSITAGRLGGVRARTAPTAVPCL